MIHLRPMNTKKRQGKDYEDFKRLKLQVIEKIYQDGKNRYHIRDTDTEIYTEGDIFYNIDHRKAKVLLIEYAGETVGCIEYFLEKHPYDYSKQSVTLNILGVDPKYRGKGIGREALKIFQSKIKHQIFLDHFFNTSNGFYNKIGAEVVQEKIRLKEIKD